VNVDLKRLVGKLNQTTRRALESAAGICVSRTNYDVEVEHWLLKLLEVDNTDLSRLLRHFEIDQSRLVGDLTRAVDQLKTGNSRSPGLSPKLVDLVQKAWVYASIELTATAVRSSHLLVAMLANFELAQMIRESAPALAEIEVDSLRRDLQDVIAGSAEEETVGSHTDKSGPSPAELKGSGKTPSLDQFTINLTLRAQQGQIDPVLGRDAEIRQLVDILMRRRQNNPILTGEAGVGKTAVVEGFALRIAADDVPPPLQNVSLRTLDLGLLQAGAGVKGEFENRLKSVINEVKASPQPIILFIDEAHTLIGAGGQAGSGDAANLLKPALARGELRTIAATTWSEYKKYFEKDAALARRFQVVKVEEPAEAHAISMMRGLVGTMEEHHNLKILDEAIEDAVRLSSRYITGRQLPDKSVSVLDTACARVAVGHNAIPSQIEDTRRRLDQLELQMRILKRETVTGSDHNILLEELKTEKADTESHLAELEKRWSQELDLVTQIREIRSQLEQSVSDFVPPDDAEDEGEDSDKNDVTAKPANLSDAEAAELRNKLSELNAELSALQGESPLMQVCVDSQAVAEVISGWTGIPVGKMLTDEIRQVSTLQEKLSERIVGQSHALEAISKRIQTARANLVDPRRPIGVFMLVGPSGVGKTETALSLAETLYGGERNLVTINMSEYQESHTVSSLKGSPPGYVGYGEGGVLTEAVRRKPYCVVLLDEIEKSHQDVQELFYQVFDKGTLEDGEGRVIDFKNTVILLTSNVGTDTIQALCADPETRPDAEGLAEALRPDLLKAFKPAFLGRMAIVPYFSLADDVLRSIIELQLGHVATRLRENHHAAFEYEPTVVDQILARCRETESGARKIDNILTDTLLPAISQEVLARMAEEQPISLVHISIADDGGFAYKIT
jgi:type VI secretion system protein VasG